MKEFQYNFLGEVKVSERKIGGSYHCRICGDIHGCFPCNQKALPLQAVQISIENSEDFFANSLMLMGQRKIIKELFKELRILFGVPEEKIYNINLFLDEEKWKEVEKDFKELELAEKAKFEFNPTLDVLGKASTIISRVCDFAVNNVYVTKAQEEEMMSVISSLKNEVLKK